MYVAFEEIQNFEIFLDLQSIRWMKVPRTYDFIGGYNAVQPDEQRIKSYFNEDELVEKLPIDKPL